MDQRQLPRLDGTGPIRVTVLGDGRRQVAGRAIRFSDEGLRLLLAEATPPGTPLCVEWEDSEVLGEVRYCDAREDGFAVGLAIEHALVGTRELARLASRLLGESESDPVRLP